jgi:hypothetical protein
LIVRPAIATDTSQSATVESVWMVYPPKKFTRLRWNFLTPLRISDRNCGRFNRFMEETMKRYLLTFTLVAAMGLALGCGGKKEDGDGGEVIGPGKFESFEKAVADTRELVGSVVLKKDKELAASAAERAEASWEDVKVNFPAEPPVKFED